MNIRLVKTVHPVKVGTTNTTSIAFHRDSSIHVKRQKLLEIEWTKESGGFEGVRVTDAQSGRKVLIPESNISYMEEGEAIKKDFAIKHPKPEPKTEVVEAAEVEVATYESPKVEVTKAPAKTTTKKAVTKKKTPSRKPFRRK